MKKRKKIYLQQKKRYLNSCFGTIEKPRLSVFRSNQHIYAQLIDDQKGHTLAFSSTQQKIIQEQIFLIETTKTIKKTATREASFLVGKQLALQAKKKEIEKIVFDRGNKPYHGRIQSVAEGAREQGLFF